MDTKGSNTAFQDDVKVIQIEYFNDESIKHALTGMDVIINAVPIIVVDIQVKSLQWPRKLVSSCSFLLSSEQ
jgi:hypothetical protein